MLSGDGSGPLAASILLSPRPLSPRATLFLVLLHVSVSLNVCVQKSVSKRT